MLKITNDIAIDPSEVELSAVRAQGSGGQNVNKVATAIHLRFDIHGSSLPEAVRARLLAMRDQRISADGVVVIKAQRFRTQEKNRADAIERLRELLASACRKPKRRIATRPTRASRERRLQAKGRRGQVKALRGKVKE